MRTLPAEGGAKSGEDLEIALMIAGKAHDQLRGAGIRIALEVISHSGGRSAIVGLPAAERRRRLAIVILEKSVDLLLDSSHFLVDRQHHRGFGKVGDVGVTIGGDVSRSGVAADGTVSGISAAVAPGSADSAGQVNRVAGGAPAASGGGRSARQPRAGATAAR